VERKALAGTRTDETVLGEAENSRFAQLCADSM